MKQSKAKQHERHHTVNNRQTKRNNHNTIIEITTNTQTSIIITSGVCIQMQKMRMKQQTRKLQKAGSTLRSSRAVPHPSTNRALRRLTSEVGRDPVHSARYGRQRQTFSARRIVLGVCCFSFTHRSLVYRVALYVSFGVAGASCAFGAV